MKKVVGLVVLGIGGLAAAIALTVGALALAGDDVGKVVQPALTPSTPGSRAPGPSAGEDRSSSTPSPSVDDHGGATSGTGSDDLSGSGSSGSGSSGSGSSGSASSSSGSGSSESGSHDDD
jgi:hypothetical protein